MKSAAVLLVGLATVLPQQAFRSSVNTVEIYATVVDREGRAVPDLSKDDFTISDNGKPQAIEVFSAGVQPITMALMVDESPSVAEVSARISTAVREFSKHFVSGDRATVGAFSHLVRIEPALSSTPAELVPRVLGGRPRFPSGTALWDALDAARDVSKAKPAGA